MEPAVIGSAVRDYGWLIVLAWFMVDRIWPFLAQSFFQARAAERKAERDAEERRDERQILAYEQIARAVSEITVSNAMIGERMAQFNLALMEYTKLAIEHHRMTETGINRMMERTAYNPPQQKRKPTGRGES